MLTFLNAPVPVWLLLVTWLTLILWLRSQLLKRPGGAVE
jgi:hypothetical protein